MGSGPAQATRLLAMRRIVRTETEEDFTPVPLSQASDGGDSNQLKSTGLFVAMRPPPTFPLPAASPSRDDLLSDQLLCRAEIARAAARQTAPSQRRVSACSPPHSEFRRR